MCSVAMIRQEETDGLDKLEDLENTISLKNISNIIPARVRMRCSITYCLLTTRKDAYMPGRRRQISVSNSITSATNTPSVQIEP